MPPVDHLVWGGPNLEEEIERFEGWTGVRAAMGGQHPGEGTRNALIGLGPAMYLELIGPDPAQEAPRHPRWFGLDTLTEPRLITWAAKWPEGVLGDARNGRRELSGGRVLSWRFTYPDLRQGDGLIPFLIDWGDSTHPALTAPSGIQLVSLRGKHPDPAPIVTALHHLGLEFTVEAGPEPALVAMLDTPRGRVELRPANR